MSATPENATVLARHHLLHPHLPALHFHDYYPLMALNDDISHLAGTATKHVLISFCATRALGHMPKRDVVIFWSLII